MSPLLNVASKGDDETVGRLALLLCQLLGEFHVSKDSCGNSCCENDYVVDVIQDEMQSSDCECPQDCKNKKSFHEGEGFSVQGSILLSGWLVVLIIHELRVSAQLSWVLF